MTNTPRILPDLSASASSAGDSELVTAIKAIIAQVDCKTADFVQLVLAEAAASVVDGEFDRVKSIKSPKDLIAKWRKHLPIKQLLPTCKLVAGDLSPKPSKVKKAAVKRAEADRPKTSKPKVAKKATQVNYAAMNMLFPGHLPQPTAKAKTKKEKLAEAVKTAPKPEQKGIDKETFALLFPHNLDHPVELAMAA